MKWTSRIVSIAGLLLLLVAFVPGYQNARGVSH